MKRNIPFMIVAIVLVALLFSACSASQHASITYVQKPDIKETNEAVWLGYWQDQFDAFEGNVIPTEIANNEASKQAYQRAKMEWDRKVAQAATNTNIILYGSLIAVPLALTILLLK